MNDSVLLLTPFVVLLILVLYRFIGCASFSAADEPEQRAIPPGAIPPTSGFFSYENILNQTPGITVYWLLNETSGTTAQSHGSLSPGANGTYIGVKLDEDGVFFGKNHTDRAPSFGGNGYIDVPFNSTLNPNPTLPFSIELWVKPQSTAGGNTQVLISSHYQDNPSNRGYEISLSRVGQSHQAVTAQVFAKAGITTVTLQPTAGTNQRADDWRHIVMTYQPPVGVPPRGSPGVLRLYATVVGVPTVVESPSKTVDEPYTPIETTSPVTFRIGAGHSALPAATAENPFTGRIDNVAFYKGVLPLAVVQDHFAKY